MTAAVATAPSLEYRGGALPPNPRPVLSVTGGDPEQVVQGCNKDGMDYLRKGQYKQAFEQLKYAEAVLQAAKPGAEDEPSPLMATTCNNLGCYYKKVGKLHAALSYLRKALKMEVALQTDDVTVAGTHLNICAILSKLDKHDKAVQHALGALELVSVRASMPEATQEECAVLAIAYHNVAVERDYMQQFELAAAAYQQGHQVARKCLGDQHPLTQTLAKNCEATQKVGHHRQPASPLAGTRRSASPNRFGGGPACTGGFGGASLLPEIGGGSHTRSLKAAEPAFGAASVRQEASEWAQSGDAAAAATAGWQAPLVGSASIGQLPPLAPSYPLIAASAAQAPSSFLDRLVQEVPAAAAFAAPPASPPPLVVKSQSSGSRSARARAREASRAESPSPMQLEPVAPPPPQEVPRPRRGGGVPAAPAAPPAPAPPAGRPGRPQRGGALSARAQRDLARAGGREPLGGSIAADQVASGGLSGGLRPQHSQLLRKSAACRIQRVWRAYARKQMATGSRADRERRAATKLQARWRCFIVQRRRRHKAAIAVQRFFRGFVVRLATCRRRASIRIQRQARGMFVRRMLRRHGVAATAVQRVMRGALARMHTEAYRKRANLAALNIQCLMRVFKAKKVLNGKLRLRDFAQAKVVAATRIQSVVRGNKGRERFRRIKEEHDAYEEKRMAATKLQATARRRAAEQKADSIRSAKLEVHCRAAIVIRKHWLRYHTRKRYLELREEYKLHEPSIIVMQRYVRGYVVRMRMWRNAIRKEEELWAAVEIQRCWRGFRGRVRWETEWTRVHSRLQSACRIQRHVRGWLARTRAHRMRKRLARAEFELARRRFKAAQRIQALVRGRQGRRRVDCLKDRKVQAVTKIQSVHRGRRLRLQRQAEARHRHTVRIQAAMRGFLVRNRRFHVLVQVVCIQENWRRYQRFIPEAERTRRLERRRARRALAKAPEVAEEPPATP